MGDITVSVGVFLAFLIIFGHWFSLRRKKKALQKVKPDLQEPRLSVMSKKKTRKFDNLYKIHHGEFH